MKRVFYLFFLTVFLFSVFPASLFSQGTTAMENAALLGKETPLEPVVQTVNWWVGKPIVDMQFEGLKNVLESQLFSFKKNYLNKKFSDELYLELYSELMKLDFFDRFEVYPIDSSNPKNQAGMGRKESLILKFVVYENPILDTIFIEGNKSIRKSDLLAELVSVVGDPFKRSNLRVDRKALQLYYANKGYPETEVKSRYDLDEENGKVVLFFEISEGVKRVVKDITFNGNHLFSKLKLMTSIKTKVQSLIEAGIYDETLLDNDIAAIETLYKEKGYIEAKVVEVKKIQKLNEAIKQEEFSLIFEINEGDCFYYGGTDFFGNEIFQTKILEAAIPLKAGSVLNQVKLDQGLLMVQQLYYADGYVYTEFQPTKMVSEDGKMISYRLNIVERPRAHIENIVIRGLSKTKESVVRRELPFKEGDVFSNSRLMAGLRNLMQLGYFSSVDRKIELGSAPLLMNLIIIVEEGRTLDVQFGVNFSESVYDEIPIQLFLSLGEKNLAGEGHHLGVSTELNGNTQKISLTYSDRWIGEERVGIGASIGFEHNKRSLVYQDLSNPVGSGLPDPYTGDYYFSKDTVVNGKQYKKGDKVDWDRVSKEQIEEYNLVTDYDYFTSILGESSQSDHLMKYSRFNLFAGINSGYSWNTSVGLLSINSGIHFNLEKNSYDANTFRPIEPWLQEHNNEWVWTNSWTTKFALDSRNHPVHPTDGLLLKQIFTYTGGILLGSTHYNKSRTTFEYYKTLFDIPVTDWWHYKTVFAMHSSLHFFFDQLFLEKNSAGKIQSFSGTRDRVVDKLYTDRMNTMRGWNNRTNLEAIWENWLELRMPIYEKYVWADLFFEMTGIWNDLSDMKVGQGNYSHEHVADHFYFTMGAGFRLTLEGFPIAIYLTKGFQVDYNNHNPYANWDQGSINPLKTEKGGVNFVFRLIYSF